MHKRITFLDRLRARLTGQPAQAYANRRLARADLHALEEHRARAVRRLNEDIEILDRYVNPLERFMDGDRILTPLGTILDRRGGKNLPLVWTELDLREFRRWARIICDVNPFAVGFLGLLTDFHIRQGFGWQAASSLVTRHLSFGKTTDADARVSSRRTRDGGPRTPKDKADDKQQRAITRCQQVLDEWRATNNWGLRSREAFRRWRRDGEVFLRFFLGGEETWGLPQVRFVEPEQVGPPPGEDADGDWSFGVLTETEDVETVKAYFVRDPLGSGDEGDEVPAARVLHLKANVDSSIKRGLPDFLPVQEDLERVRRLLRNMGEVAAVQSAIAWVSQYATATVDQVGTLIRAGSDYTRPKLNDPSGRLMDVVNYEPGTVLHMDANRQFLAGPVGTGTAGFIQVEQAILRGCGARWRFPEYFSGDASNNNMASSIVAGSPFVVAVEGNQLEWGEFERAVARKVLELCVESGRLSGADVAAVDVKVTPPAVALEKREEEERIRQMRHEAGVLSITTWQQQVGLDPAHEAANFEMEAKRKGRGGGEAAGEKEEAKESCCDEGVVNEAKGRSVKGFTGMERDSRGRKRCYRDGKEVPCDGSGVATKPSNASDATSKGTGSTSPAAKARGGIAASSSGDRDPETGSDDKGKKSLPPQKIPMFDSLHHLEKPLPTANIQAKTFDEFQAATKGWFTEESIKGFMRKPGTYTPAQFEKAAWRWYQDAKDGKEVPILGDFQQLQNILDKRPDNFQRLSSRPWNLQVNDAWIIGAVERGAKFRVASDITKAKYRSTVLSRRPGKPRVESVFHRELRLLKERGYRFVPDKGNKGTGYLTWAPPTAR